MKKSINSSDIGIRSLIPYAVITFGIAWGVLGFYIFMPEFATDLCGELSGRHPLFYLAVYAPALAAFFLVARRGGVAGLRRFAARGLLWRCSPAWAAFLLIGVPLPFFAGAALAGKWPAELFSFPSCRAYLSALLFMAIKGPIEEFGWRGLALPLLQRKVAPIWAALILGIIWAIWHAPAFLLSGTPQGAWSLTPFLLGTVALSVIVTPLYNSSRGSILLPALFHLQLINPLWPEAQPYDTAIFVLVAIGIVWLNRETMFTRAAALTAVIGDE